MDSNVYTAFAHNIRLVDGVYLQKSISSYAAVISALTEGGGVHTYTAVEGDTVQSVVYTTGVSFDSLAQMNPELLTLDQEIPEGTVLLTGASSAELIKVKVVRRDTETVPIPYDTQNSESDQYDFGKVVTLQEGVDGSEEITYETTMIDGTVTDRQAVAYNVLQAATPKITVTGTKLKSGMVAKRSEERRVGKECRSRWSPYHRLRLRHGHCSGLALLLRQLRRDRPRQRLQNAVRPYVRDRGHAGAGCHAGSDHRLCRLYRQLHR